MKNNDKNEKRANLAHVEFCIVGDIQIAHVPVTLSLLKLLT